MVLGQAANYVFANVDDFYVTKTIKVQSSENGPTDKLDWESKFDKEYFKYFPNTFEFKNILKETFVFIFFQKMDWYWSSFVQTHTKLSVERSTCATVYMFNHYSDDNKSSEAHSNLINFDERGVVFSKDAFAYNEKVLELNETIYDLFRFKRGNAYNKYIKIWKLYDPNFGNLEIKLQKQIFDKANKDPSYDSLPEKALFNALIEHFNSILPNFLRDAYKSL